MNESEVLNAISKCIPKCEKLSFETWHYVNCDELKKKFPNAIINCSSEWEYKINFKEFDIYPRTTSLKFKK
jgi:hypothetical protein